MAAEPVDIDMETLTPEQFARLVKDSPDDVMLATFHKVGTQPALDRIFAIMQERYVGGSKHNATIQWRIIDGSQEHPYVVTLREGHCQTTGGTLERPTTTLTIDLARFARVVAGQASGVKLLMMGKLKASGDVNLARKLPTLFDIPKV